MQTKNLINEMKKREKAIEKENRDLELPEYRADGTVIQKPKKNHKVLFLVLGILLLLLGVLYLPGVFHSFFSDVENRAGNYVNQPNYEAVSLRNEYLRDNPNADADQDGLTNEQESRFNTDPWDRDSDDDGITDYAEVFQYDSNPNRPDNTLYSVFVTADQADGNQVNTPYQIHGVTMWADDYQAKAYGTVVPTLNGYRFSNFNGWAEFPAGNYAYKIENGRHVLLEKRETENAWYIDTENEIVLYDQPLTMVHKLTIAGSATFYLEDNVFGDILSFILPDYGVLTCEEMANVDTWVDVEDEVTAPRANIEYYSVSSRFSENQNSLSRLAEIYDSINQGHAVLTSLFCPNAGEVIVEIYGVDSDGNLLICDADTLEEKGILYIEPKAENLLDENGEIFTYEYFDFYGCGFDSEVCKDVISFFAAAVSDSESGNGDNHNGNQPSNDTQPQGEENTASQLESTPTDQTTETETGTTSASFASQIVQPVLGNAMP